VPARKLIASLDWRPFGSATSFDVAVEHIGPNTGDALNRVRIDPFTTVDVGVRHRFKLGTEDVVMRLQATNLFNAYGWEVAGNNAFIYNQSRQVMARLAVDF
jgi:iron complex outermembrane receptor protein